MTMWTAMCQDRSRPNNSRPIALVPHWYRINHHTALSSFSSRWSSTTRTFVPSYSYWKIRCYKWTQTSQNWWAYKQNSQRPVRVPHPAVFWPVSSTQLPKITSLHSEISFESLSKFYLWYSKQYYILVHYNGCRASPNRPRSLTRTIQRFSQEV